MPGPRRRGPPYPSRPHRGTPRSTRDGRRAPRWPSHAAWGSFPAIPGAGARRRSDRRSRPASRWRPSALPAAAARQATRPARSVRHGTGRISTSGGRRPVRRRVSSRRPRSRGRRPGAGRGSRPPCPLRLRSAWPAPRQASGSSTRTRCHGRGSDHPPVDHPLPRGRRPGRRDGWRRPTGPPAWSGRHDRAARSGMGGCRPPGGRPRRHSPTRS